jgi:hypothetical protein
LSGDGYALPDLQLMMTRALLCCPVAASPYRAYNGELIVGRVSAAPPGFFCEEIKEK